MNYTSCLPDNNSLPGNGYLVVIGLLVLAMSGCASMSESECLIADWRTIGYEDGAAGASTGTFTERRKACAEYGMSPDLAQYKEGYGEGVYIFCTERNGYRQGKKGSQYHGVCPSEVEGGFLYGHRKGRELFKLSSGVAQKNAAVITMQARLKNLKHDINNIEDELIADGTESHRRRDLLDELEERQHERGHLEAEVRGLEFDADELRGEYQVLLDEYEIY